MNQSIIIEYKINIHTTTHVYPQILWYASE